MFEIEPGDKLKVVLAINDITHKEITRYRDYEWRITLWTVTLMAGIVAAVRSTNLSGPNQSGIQVLLTFFLLVVLCLGIGHVCFVHSRLVTNWKIRRNLDDQLGLFQKDAYFAGTVLPSEWERRSIKWTRGLPHLLTFWVIMLASATYAFYTVWWPGS